jgi:hypothetical protein
MPFFRPLIRAALVVTSLTISTAALAIGALQYLRSPYRNETDAALRQVWEGWR